MAASPRALRQCRRERGLLWARSGGPSRRLAWSSSAKRLTYAHGGGAVKRARRWQHHPLRDFALVSPAQGVVDFSVTDPIWCHFTSVSPITRRDSNT